MFLAVLLAAFAASDPVTAPVFTDVPETGTRYAAEASLYADVINRCGGGNRPVLHYDRVTNLHESSHSLAADLCNRAGAGYDAYYVLRGQSVVMRAPRTLLQAFAGRVPLSCRNSRYRIYVQHGDPQRQRVRDVLEEWSAYCNEMEFALEERRAGRLAEPNPGALVEMGIIALAAGQAVSENEPRYWEDEPQFRAFLAWQWARATKLVEEARAAFPSQEADQLAAALRDAPDAASLRTFLADRVLPPRRRQTWRQ